MSAYALPANETYDMSGDNLLNLIVRCYDALIEDFQKAKEAHAKDQKDLFLDRLRHAQDILIELFIGLDYERGGEISVNLGRLYNYMLRELIALDDSQAHESLGRMMTMTRDLREAWAHISAAV